MSFTGGVWSPRLFPDHFRLSAVYAFEGHRKRERVGHEHELQRDPHANDFDLVKNPSLNAPCLPSFFWHCNFLNRYLGGGEAYSCNARHCLFHLEYIYIYIYIYIYTLQFLDSYFFGLESFDVNIRSYVIFNVVPVAMIKSPVQPPPEV